MSQLDGIWVGQNRGSPGWKLVLRWFIMALGVALAAHTSSGISYSGPNSLGPHGFVTLALVVFVLCFFNMVLKPVLVLFTLPFVILTLGLGLWFINALLLLAATLVPGFVVDSFGSALWGALVISLVSFFVNRLLAPRPYPLNTRVLGGVSGPRPTARRDDDVIDV